MTRIGLALSGGGSRAMAFHLGCLRALNDYDLLTSVSTLSSVSGGSVIAALYAYSDDSFAEFDERVSTILRKGLVAGIARHTILSPETLKIGLAFMSSGAAALVGLPVRLLGATLRSVGLSSAETDAFLRWVQSPIPRFASRSTAFRRYLDHSLFDGKSVAEVARPDLDVVINATELRTGTAFRYGNEESGCWRYGRLVGPTASVAQAVASSACYPILLPSFDQRLDFERNGETHRRRVIITDGGIYDNLAITPLLPGRSAIYSTNAKSADVIIACDAGQGLLSGTERPQLWHDRMISAMSTTHRRTHQLSYKILHDLKSAGTLQGFLLPHLGQNDAKLPVRPADLVPREQVIDYPTDFRAMSQSNLDLIAGRGEQLTRILIEQYGIEGAL